MQCIAANGSEWGQVRKTDAIEQAQEQTSRIPGGNLLERQAPALALAPCARAMHESAPPLCERRNQSRNELRAIAAVAVNEQHDFGVRPRSGNAGLYGAPIAAPQLAHDARPGSDGALGRSIL